MKSKVKRVLILSVLLIFLIGSVASFAASYTYSIGGMAQDSPDAYSPLTTINSLSIGLEVNLNNPTDIVADDDGNLYIADPKNNRIVVLDEYYSLMFEISTFKNDLGAGDDALLGYGQAVEAEHVLPVLVHHLGLQLVREAYDLDGVELALVDADAASLAEGLGDDGLAAFPECDAFGHARSDEGAEFDALLVALPVLASVVEHRRYPHGPAYNRVGYKDGPVGGRRQGEQI